MREKYVRRKKQMEIHIRDTRVDNTWATDQRENLLRYYRDEKMNFAYIVGSFDEEKVYERLAANIGDARSYTAMPQRNRQENLITSFTSLDFGKMASMLALVLNQLSMKFPMLRLQAKLWLDYQEIRMNNDNNVYLNFQDQLLHGECKLYHESRPEDSVHFEVLFRNFSEKTLFEFWEEYMSAYITTPQLDLQENYKVIFSTSNVTPMRKFEKDLQPDFFASGMSELSGNIENTCFNEQMSLYVSGDPTSARVRAEEIMPFFDLEGSINPGYKKALIEDGVLLAPYACKLTAEKYGLECTASASGAWDEYPYASPIGFCLRPSEKNLKELLGGQMGIYVCDVNESAFLDRGKFEMLAKSVFLHNGERLVGRLSPVQISSIFPAMFREMYVGVSADCLMYSDINRALVCDMQVQPKGEINGSVGK